MCGIDLFWLRLDTFFSRVPRIKFLNNEVSFNNGYFHFQVKFMTKYPTKIQSFNGKKSMYMDISNTYILFIYGKPTIILRSRLRENKRKK